MSERARNTRTKHKVTNKVKQKSGKVPHEATSRGGLLTGTKQQRMKQLEKNHHRSMLHHLTVFFIAPHRTLVHTESIIRSWLYHLCPQHAHEFDHVHGKALIAAFLQLIKDADNDMYETLLNCEPEELESHLSKVATLEEMDILSGSHETKRGAKHIHVTIQGILDRQGHANRRKTDPTAQAFALDAHGRIIQEYVPKGLIPVSALRPKPIASPQFVLKTPSFLLDPEQPVSVAPASVQPVLNQTHGPQTAQPASSGTSTQPQVNNEVSQTTRQESEQLVQQVNNQQSYWESFKSGAQRVGSGIRTAWNATPRWARWVAALSALYGIGAYKTDSWTLGYGLKDVMPEPELKKWIDMKDRMVQAGFKGNTQWCWDNLGQCTETSFHNTGKLFADVATGSKVGAVTTFGLMAALPAYDPIQKFIRHAPIESYISTVAGAVPGLSSVAGPAGFVARNYILANWTPTGIVGQGYMGQLLNNRQYAVQSQVPDCKSDPFKGITCEAPKLQYPRPITSTFDGAVRAITKPHEALLAVSQSFPALDEKGEAPWVSIPYAMQKRWVIPDGMENLYQARQANMNPHTTPVTLTQQAGSVLTTAANVPRTIADELFNKAGLQTPAWIKDNTPVAQQRINFAQSIPSPQSEQERKVFDDLTKQQTRVVPNADGSVTIYDANGRYVKRRNPPGEMSPWTMTAQGQALHPGVQEILVQHHFDPNSVQPGNSQSKGVVPFDDTYAKFASAANNYYTVQVGNPLVGNRLLVYDKNTNEFVMPIDLGTPGVAGSAVNQVLDATRATDAYAAMVNPVRAADKTMDDRLREMIIYEHVNMPLTRQILYKPAVDQDNTNLSTNYLESRNMYLLDQDKGSIFNRVDIGKLDTVRNQIQSIVRQYPNVQNANDLYGLLDVWNTISDSGTEDTITQSLLKYYNVNPDEAQQMYPGVKSAVQVFANSLRSRNIPPTGEAIFKEFETSGSLNFYPRQLIGL